MPALETRDALLKFLHGWWDGMKVIAKSAFNGVVHNTEMVLPLEPFTN
jgi:hypothetical protein